MGPKTDTDVVDTAGDGDPERQPLLDGQQTPDGATSQADTTNHDDDDEEEEEFKLLNTNDRKELGLCCPQVNRQLLISKSFYFCFFSAWGSLLPYLALYFKQLMLTPSQVGVIMGLKPFVNFLATPVWGALVDKFHIYRFALIISMTALITSTFALSLVPGPKQQPIILEKHCNRTDELDMMALDGEQEVDKMVKLNDYQKDYFFSKDPLPWPLDFITSLDQEIYQKYKIDAAQTFTSLFLITLFGNLIASPALALVDTATFQMLGKQTHRYGKQRLTGSLGWGLGAFIVGASLRTTHRCSISKNREVVDFIPAFYVFAILMTLGLVVSLKFHFNTQKKAGQKRSLSVGLVALKQPTYLMFLFTALYLGFLMAFIKTFLFWHLKDLGGTQLLFSVISAVNCVAEVSMYFLSEKLIKKIGEVKVLYLGLICYSIRLFYYAVVPNTWMVLAVELLPGITTAAVWAACLSYVSKNSRPGARTTMQCILHGVHWGLGYGAGEVIGGILVHHYGAPTTFVLFGCLCIVILFIYFAVNRIWGIKIPGGDETTENTTTEQAEEPPSSDEKAGTPPATNTDNEKDADNTDNNTEQPDTGDIKQTPPSPPSTKESDDNSKPLVIDEQSPATPTKGGGEKSPPANDGEGENLPAADTNKAFEGDDSENPSAPPTTTDNDSVAASTSPKRVDEAETSDNKSKESL